jgi:hypothetical protein
MRAAQENGRGKAGLRGTSGDPSLAPPYDHVHHIRFAPALSSQPESPTQSSRWPWRKTPRGTEQRACVRHAATTRRRRWMEAQSASPVWLWSRGGPQLDYSVACRAVQDLLPCPTHASARISPTDSSLPQRRRAEPTAGIRTAALRCLHKVACLLCAATRFGVCKASPLTWQREVLPGGGGGAARPILVVVLTVSQARHPRTVSSGCSVPCRQSGLGSSKRRAGWDRAATGPVRCTNCGRGLLPGAAAVPCLVKGRVGNGSCGRRARTS